ncbi:MAG TPA: hypothetical protein PKE39_04250 [Ignavibacteria bacterium]|nr:hypothetical protein [Ignavibacteria bacterium]HMQ98214.1 hypothetical protein [Ignavibacteria bacterium]
MTKAETEEFKKEMRELRDLIIRMDEKVNNVQKELKSGNEKFADHENRLRTIEEFKTEIRTKVVVYSSVISLIAGGIVALIVKII